MNASTEVRELPLFPLQTALFPDGLLGLKVFEARYLDLIARCMRERSGFGVVRLKSGSEVRHAAEAGGAAPGEQAATPVVFDSIGTTAELLDVDSAAAGILLVRCRGTRRFEITSSHQLPDGLWMARTSPIPDDEPVAPTPALTPAVQRLADAIAAIDGDGQQPFLLPHRLDDAGWVANRWCEILPLPQETRQRLMASRDPLLRLVLVDQFLRSNGILT